MEAPWPAPPDEGLTVWLLTDTHVTPDGVPVWSMPRLTAVAADMNESTLCSRVDARLHTGDITEHGRADQVAMAKAWLDANFDDPDDVVVGGNHDFGNGWADYAKDRDAVSADYGRPMLSDVYTGPPGGQLRILGFAPFSVPVSDDPDVRNSWTFDDATLSWLDGKITEDTSTPTLLACHYALNEMGPAPIGRGVQPQATFDDFISSYDHLAGWACGHSHLPTFDPNCVTALQVGSRPAFPHFCGPSTAHTNGRYNPEGYPADARYPYRSMFLTFLGDHWQVRYRDHGARQWVTGENGEQVTVVNVP
jgi:hypothetical protein